MAGSMPMFIVLVLFSIMLMPDSSIGVNTDFRACQKVYYENFGSLVAVQGVDAASSVWRILFNKLDLNKNRLLSSAEILLTLEAENLVTKEQIPEALSQTQTWIDSTKGDNNFSELNLSGFRDLLSNTIGRRPGNKEPSARRNWLLTSLLCHFVNEELTSILSSIRDLKNCTDSLRTDQHGTLKSSTRLILNVWKAVYKTLDRNNDDRLETDEIRNILQQYFDQNDTNDIAQAFPTLSAASGAGVSRLQFFKMVNNLLSAGASGNTWDNTRTLQQLNGNVTFCRLLYRVRSDLNVALEQNDKCRTTFIKRANKVFGQDVSVASGFIFAYLDKDKNGVITLSELSDELVENNLSEILPQPEFVTPTNLTKMEKFLAYAVTIAGPGNNSKHMELSLLSLSQQKTWNTFCKLSVCTIAVFPGANTESNLQHNGRTNYSKGVDIITRPKTSPSNQAFFGNLIEKRNRLNNSSNNNVTIDITTSIVTTTETSIIKEYTTASSISNTDTLNSTDDAFIATVSTSQVNLGINQTETTSTNEANLNLTENYNKNDTNTESFSEELSREEAELLRLFTEFHGRNPPNESVGKPADSDGGNLHEPNDVPGVENQLHKLLMQAVMENTEKLITP
nr:uncharacterized protein LOC100184432 isoform X2 [Ciona intestinalis]|eukprot:XP_002128210.2 uncharacterized protein LOC100184432 isoform X2 [Ciona intestinalis]